MRSQAPSVFPLVLCDFWLIWKLMLEVNTLPWFWRSLSFLSRWGVEKTGELGRKTDEGQLCSLPRRESTGRDHSSNLTCCPLTFCPIPVPWNQFTRWTCLPTQPECAGKLEWLPGSPPEGSPGDPRKVNLPGERLGARPQHWPPGGAGKPTQRTARFPEKPIPAPDPRHLSTDAQTQARSFPDRGQARPAPGSPCPSAHRTAAAKLLQLCLPLCDPTDSSPPGFPVPGILQARTMEWVASSFSSQA